MIESSFCFLPGVGIRTERRFWHEGLYTWEQFLKARDIPGIGPVRRAQFDQDIREAQEHFARADSRYFANLLLSRHQWRLYEWLRA